MFAMKPTKSIMQMYSTQEKTLHKNRTARKVEKINCQTTQTVTQQQFKQDDSLFLKGFGREDAHWRMLAALWSSLKLSLSLFNVTAWSSNTYSKTTREFSCKQEEGKEKKTVKKARKQKQLHTQKKRQRAAQHARLNLDLLDTQLERLLKKKKNTKEEKFKNLNERLKKTRLSSWRLCV